jgi:CO/xanthine dehydrogenase FAD-binding subunit
MKPAPFDYFAAHSLDEALSLLRQHGEEARPLAGGQSLVPMMALRLARPAVLVDLNPVASLAGIEVRADHLRIGAMTRQADILSSAEVRRHAPLLAQALSHVGHPPTRNRGTVGGSLSLADPSAELPVAMVALGACLTLHSSKSTRAIAAADFFKDAFETALAADELLVSIEIPHSRPSSAFCEISPRKGDFAIVAAAALLDCDSNGICRSCRVVLGGVAGAPVVCQDIQQRLVGERLDVAAIASAISSFPAEKVETEDRRAGRAYRRKVAPVMARRALVAALATSGEGAR